MSKNPETEKLDLLTIAVAVLAIIAIVWGRPTAFGHPIIPAAEALGSDHLSVHVVHHIH